jgi:branched-chain amino acid transport system permease protein
MLGVILSTQIVLYALFGGVGILIGAVVGVVAIEIVSFVLADAYPTVWPIILGLLLLLVILFRPGGLISVLVPRRERIAVLGLGQRGPRRAQAEAIDGAA